MASRRAREELVIVMFQEPPEEANCFLARWCGEDGERPSRLVFDVGRSEFLDLPAELLATRVASLETMGSEIYAGYWTDEWGPTRNDTAGEKARLRFRMNWKPGEPTTRQLLDLRECHPSMGDRSITELRDEMRRHRFFAFEIDAETQEEGQELLSRLRALQIHASVEIVDTTPVWPPSGG